MFTTKYFVRTVATLYSTSSGRPTKSTCNINSYFVNTSIHICTVYQKYFQPQLRIFMKNQCFHESLLRKNCSRLGDALDVRLWPYGKATTRKLRLNIELSSCVKLFLIVFSGGGFEFQCQHGEEECEGNIWHACTSRYVNERILEKENFIKQ